MPHPTDAIRQRASSADQRMAVIATDSTGTVVYWNAEAERLYGWTAVERSGATSSR